jgi:D-alanyl-D-alanine carboxypeptidase
MPENNQKIIKVISSPFFVGILFAVSLFLIFSIGNQKDEELVITPEKKESLFENLEVEAKAALVWDVSKKEVLFEKNPEAQLPLASLSKVLLAKVAVDNIGRYGTVEITRDSLLSEGDSGLFLNEEWILENLIDLTLVSSSNDGAKAIAGAFRALSGNPDIVGVMNREAKELELNQTYFLNESGLDKGGSLSGAYGSARDMVILFEKVLKENPELLEATSFPKLRVSSLDSFHEVTNTNNLTETLPGVIASKTGFTELAGGNLVMVFEIGPGKKYIIAVMGSSLEERFKDMEKLYLTLLRDLDNEK